jgi:uncharacterized membrane protein
MRELEQARLPVIFWWVALFSGALLRARQWSVERSIWLDEASLLRNILRRSERGLLKPLDFAPNAPILYLEAVKESSRIFGVSEAALRLPALLSGLLALPLFGLPARRTVSLWPAALATFLFAILLPSVTHSAEVKQYASDELAALAITLLALNPACVSTCAPSSISRLSTPSATASPIRRSWEPPPCFSCCFSPRGGS